VHLAVERRSGDAEVGGGLLAVAVGVDDCADDGVAFERVDRRQDARAGGQAAGEEVFPGEPPVVEGLVRDAEVVGDVLDAPQPVAAGEYRCPERVVGIPRRGAGDDRLVSAPVPSPMAARCGDALLASRAVVWRGPITKFGM
jgi:hypothetical protein